MPLKMENIEELLERSTSPSMLRIGHYLYEEDHLF